MKYSLVNCGPSIDIVDTMLSKIDSLIYNTGYEDEKIMFIHTFYLNAYFQNKN